MNDVAGEIRYMPDGEIYICTVGGSPGEWKLLTGWGARSRPMVSSMPPVSSMLFGIDPAFDVAGMNYPASAVTKIKATEDGKAINEEQAKREAEKRLTGLSTRKVVPKGGTS